MQTKFKKQQKVRLLVNPDTEYIEYRSEEEIPIKKGMLGIINIHLPNGQYHVKILDEEGNVIAYVPLGEEDLEAVD